MPKAVITVCTSSTIELQVLNSRQRQARRAWQRQQQLRRVLPDCSYVCGEWRGAHAQLYRRRHRLWLHSPGARAVKQQGLVTMVATLMPRSCMPEPIAWHEGCIEIDQHKTCMDRQCRNASECKNCSGDANFATCMLAPGCERRDTQPAWHMVLRARGLVPRRRRAPVAGRRDGGPAAAWRRAERHNLQGFVPGCRTRRRRQRERRLHHDELAARVLHVA